MTKSRWIILVVVACIVSSVGTGVSVYALKVGGELSEIRLEMRKRRALKEQLYLAVMIAADLASVEPNSPAVVDPWGNEIMYLYLNSEVIGVVSFGPNGRWDYGANDDVLLFVPWIQIELLPRAR